MPMTIGLSLRHGNHPRVVRSMFRRSTLYEVYPFGVPSRQQDRRPLELLAELVLVDDLPESTEGRRRPSSIFTGPSERLGVIHHHYVVFVALFKCLPFSFGQQRECVFQF